MKTTTLTLAVSLAMPLINAKANLQDDNFQKLAGDYVEGQLAAHPEYATELGDHRFDDQLSDYSPDSRLRQLTRARQFRDAMKEFSDSATLTGANQVDRSEEHTSELQSRSDL